MTLYMLSFEKCPSNQEASVIKGAVRFQAHAHKPVGLCSVFVPLLMSPILLACSLKSVGVSLGGGCHIQILVSRDGHYH